MKSIIAATSLAVPAVVNPTPEAPPGSDGLLTILNWVMWGVIALGVFGLLIAIGLVFFGVVDNRSSIGFKAFIIVCAALALVGAVGQIVNFLM